MRRPRLLLPKFLMGDFFADRRIYYSQYRALHSKLCWRAVKNVSLSTSGLKRNLFKKKLVNSLHDQRMKNGQVFFLTLHIGG